MFSFFVITKLYTVPSGACIYIIHGFPNKRTFKLIEVTCILPLIEPNENVITLDEVPFADLNSGNALE
jgi:hypothetical protein